LLDPNIPGNKQKQVDKWLGILIVLNLFSLVFEQVPAIFEPNKNLFHYFDVFSVIVFTIEYAFRFYLAPEDEEFKNKRNARLGFVTSPFAIIALLPASLHSGGFARAAGLATAANPEAGPHHCSGLPRVCQVESGQNLSAENARPGVPHALQRQAA
jgi:hypothetical protein